MTLLQLLSAQFRKIFAFTFISVFLVSCIYVLFVWITAERAAVGLVEEHIRRLVEGSSLRAEELFIQREVSSFTKSLGETQSFAAEVSVYENNKLLAQAKAGRELGLRVTSLQENIQLPSGQTLTIQARIDMSVQILLAIGAAAILGLITSTSLLLTHRYLKQSVASEVQPISRLSANLELISSQLPASLTNNTISEITVASSTEVQSLIKSHSLLFSKLDELYREQEKNQFLKARAEIAAQVSHDIRSPLSAINILAKTLETDAGEKTLILKSAVKRINDIATDLLAHEKSIVSAKNDSVSLTEMLKQLSKQKSIEYSNCHELIFENDLKHPVFAKCNAKEIERAVSNLINNSVEAMNGFGTIHIGVRGENGIARIVIQDNGPGIPQNVLENLGARGNTGSQGDANKGSGLGLYHAKKTAEAHGGQLIIQSSQAQGTICTIVLKT